MFSECFFPFLCGPILAFSRWSELNGTLKPKKCRSQMKRINKVFDAFCCLPIFVAETVLLRQWCVDTFHFSQVMHQLFSPASSDNSKIFICAVTFILLVWNKHSCYATGESNVELYVYKTVLILLCMLKQLWFLAGHAVSFSLATQPAVITQKIFICAVTFILIVWHNHRCYSMEESSVELY